MLEIPLIATVNQELLIVLGEQNCTLAVYQRNDAVFLDLAVGDQVVCRGAACVPGEGIVQVAQQVFSGQLYLVDEQNQGSEQAMPQWRGLGSRWRLYYLTANEVAEMAAREWAAALAGGSA